MNSVKIGPAGWAYPDWKGVVYPKRKPRDFYEAAYLAQYFDAIEINTSFYSPIEPNTARKWLDFVAGNPRFQFTAKTSVLSVGRAYPHRRQSF